LQAYVLYLFLALLVAYLGDGEEMRVVELLEEQPKVRVSLMGQSKRTMPIPDMFGSFLFRQQRPQIRHLFPFSMCLSGYVPHGADFLKFCKFGTMQYIVLKPASTLCAVILSVRHA